MNNGAGRNFHIKSLEVSAPAIYLIEVQGTIEQKLSDNLSGMNITSYEQDGKYVTTLIGRLKDQAALAGLLKALIDLRLPILLVEYKG